MNVSRRRIAVFFPLLQVALDYFAIVGAVSAAYALRSFSWVTSYKPIAFGSEFSFDAALSWAWAIAALWIALLALAGAYRDDAREGFSRTFARVAYGFGGGWFLLVSYFFFSQQPFNSRFLLVGVLAIGFLFILASHGAVRALRSRLARAGYGSRALAIVGNGSRASFLFDFFKNNPAYGFVPALVAPDGETIPSDANWRSYEALLVATDAPTPALLAEASGIADAYQLQFLYVADVVSARAENTYVEAYGGIPLVSFHRTRLQGWGRVWKRAFDLALCVALAVPFALLFAFIAVFIKAETKGPVLVRLRRVGMRGEEFDLFKFRSMVDGAAAMKDSLLPMNERADGPLFKLKNDPRVTRVGKFLRSTSLDELAQIINVFKNEMSFVGPRPHEPREVSSYTNVQRKVLAVKPGITGLAQISGRSSLGFDEEVRLDTYYVESWSVALDLRIAAQTPFVLLAHRDHAV